MYQLQPCTRPPKLWPGQDAPRSFRPCVRRREMDLLTSPVVTAFGIDESNLRLPPEPLPHAMHQHRSFRSSKRLPPIGPTRPNTRLSPGAGTEWAATSLRLSHRAACFRHAFTRTLCALDSLFQPWLAADRRGHVPPSTSATETILEHACEYSRPQHDPKVRLRVAISRRIRQPGFVSSGASPLP